MVSARPFFRGGPGRVRSSVSNGAEGLTSGGSRRGADPQIGLCVAVGFLAARYGRSGFGWFVMSMILSPLLGFVFVLALGRRTTT
jgi:hypothetical protein